MKFILSNIDVSEAVSKMGRLMTAKTTIPVLEGVLVEALKDCIMFTASDGTETIIHRIMIDPVDGNSIVAEGRSVFTKDAFDVARKMKGHITFEVKGDTQVSVSIDKTNMEFPVMSAADYPKTEMGDSPNSVVLSGTEFAKVTTQTTFAASKQEMRPILMGVNMSFKKGENMFVSTDSHRLSRLQMKGIDNLEEDIQVTVPATLLDKAVKSFDLSKDVIILPKTNSIALANGNTIFISRLLEGAFPDTSRLIPSDFATDLIVNRKELIDGLELLETLNASVQLKVDGLFVELSSSNSVGSKGTKELAFESYDGEEGFTIAFSASYVLDVLKRMDENSVKLRFNGQMKPFVIVSANEDETDTVQLVLPVRTV